MAGLKDTLELDIDRALASIHTVENALDSAARTFRVELARSLDVLRAVDVPDVEVAVHADTTGVAEEIERAVAVEPVEVPVNVSVDDAQAQAELGQLSLFDTNVDVAVTVSGEEAVKRTDAAVEELGAETDRTSKQADEMGSRFGKAGSQIKQALAVVGVAGIVKGIQAAGEAASDLAENQSKANVVFGDSIGLVNKFTEDSATSVGLSKQAALGFAGTFGNLFVALKLSQDQAAGLSTGIVTLGADLASFNNLEVDETLEKLRSGLVGEAEPLRSLGVNITAATTLAKGMELGLVGVNGEMSEAQKVQARYAEIMDQTSVAQGDFARTSAGIANQQRIAKAELQDAAAVIGVQLLPVLLDFVHSAREDLVPALTSLATSAVPAFAAGMHAFVPIGLSVVDVLVALTPLLQLLGTLLEAIPTPLLTVVTTAALLSSGLGPLPSAFSGVAKAMEGVSGAGAKAAAGLAAVNVPLLAVTAVVGLAVAAWSAHQKAQEADRKAVEDATKAFVDQAGAIDASSVALTQARVQSKHQQDDLEALGLSFSAFDAIARGSDQGVNDFVDNLLRLGEVTSVSGRLHVDDAAAGIEKFGSLSDFASKGLQGEKGLINSLVTLRKSFQEGAKQAAVAALGTEAVTQAQYDLALANATAADGSVDYLKALAELERVQVREAAAAAAAAKQRAAVYGATFTGQVEAAVVAMTAAADKTDALTDAHARLGDQQAIVEARFRAGAVSAADLAVMADATGLSFEQLLAVGADTAAMVDEFAGQVVDGLSTIQTAMGEIKEDDSLDSFLKNMTNKVTSSALFLTTIDKLIARGADDLAATFAARGIDSATAAGQAAALNDKALAKAEAQVEDAERIQSENVTNAKRIGGELVVAASNTKEDLENVGPPDLVGPFAIEAGNLAIAAEALGPTLEPIVRTGAEKAGLAFGAGIESGAAGAHTQVGAAGAAAAYALVGDTGPLGPAGIADTSGGAIGGAFMDGILRGLAAKVPEVEGAGTALAGKLSGPMRDALGMKSPSRVAIAIGQEFVAGLTIGLADTAAAERAAADLANQIAAAAAGSAPATIPVTAAFTAASVAPPPVVVGASAGAGLGGNGGVVVNGPMFDGVVIEQGVDAMHVFAEARQQLVEVSVPVQ